MRLYELTEEDVERVIDSGEKRVTADGKLTYLGEIRGRFKYPVRVICVEEGNTILVVSAYPLRKRRFQDEGDI